MKNRKYTEEEIKIICECAGVLSAEEVAKRLDRPRAGIVAVANRVGLSYRKNKEAVKPTKAESDKPLSIGEINRRARAEGLTYGQYVAKYNV